MFMVWNILIGLVLAAAALGGIALFWIARQDDSRAGRLVGLLVLGLAIISTLYLALGPHWF